MPADSTTTQPSPVAPRTGGARAWLFLRAHVWRGAALLCVAFFLFQIASFCFPRTGFSNLISIGDQRQVVTKLRETRPFIYHQSPGYDGQAYVQLALHPLLDGTELQSSLDNLPYRARRILTPWIAWLCGLGQPTWIVQAYALLNVVSWLALAGLLLRWLPLSTGEDFLRWGAILFSHGLILCVRESLPDGPSLLLLLLGVAYLEKRNRAGAIGVFAAAILSRETLVLNTAAAVVEPSARRWSDLRRPAIALVLMILPLVLWLAYIKWRVHEVNEVGLGNFEIPFAAWIGKATQLLGEVSASSFASWFFVSACLAWISISVQFVFFAFRWRMQELWWRIGASSAALMVVLGTAVWEGYPGAFIRVLLPMTVAFNIALPRGRRWLAVLILGNLSVIGGIEEFTRHAFDFIQLEGDQRIIASSTTKLGEGWYNPELSKGHRWCWCAQNGTLLFENKQDTAVQISISATLIPCTPRIITLEGPSGQLWTSGTVSKNTELQTKPFLLPPGRSILRFSSNLPAVTPGSETRLLAFALRDMTLTVEPKAGP